MFQWNDLTTLHSLQKQPPPRHFTRSELPPENVCRALSRPITLWFLKWALYYVLSTGINQLIPFQYLKGHFYHFEHPKGSIMGS